MHLLTSALPVLQAHAAVLPAGLSTHLAPAGLSGVLDPATLLQGLGPATLAVVALLVFIESGVLFPFLPGDSLLFTAGLLHAQLHLPLPVLIGVVALAAIAGNEVGYLIGRRFGRRWFTDTGRVLNTAHLAETEAFFARHGGLAVVLARFVPVVRTFTPLVAGTARYDRRKFLLWNVAGSVAWSVSVVLLGTWLGHYEIIAKNIDVIAVLIVAASLLPAAIGFLHKRRKAARASQAAAAAAVAESAAAAAAVAETAAPAQDNKDHAHL